jgi:predicted DNA-binding transcriptional regulator YafY
MRADRLIALLLLLQTRGRVTANDVAVELEISPRTARRDLEALAMSGVPIYSTPGRGGGWQLIGGARTDLTGLSADEARALFLAAGPALDSTPQLKSAMRKLTGALPETFRAEAEAASAAVKVDPNGWGHVRGSPPKYLDPLIDSVVRGRHVSLDYVSPRSGPSCRVVHPLGLVTKRGIWYLVANTDVGLRTFRVGRVRRVEVLTELVQRPSGFDLEAEWERIVSEIESSRVGITVNTKAEKDMLSPLRFQFGGRMKLGDADPDGRTNVTISEQSVAALAAQLAGYGTHVEVVDPPPELRQEFRRITSELAGQWL